MESKKFVKPAFMFVVFVCALAYFFIKTGIQKNSAVPFVKNVSAASDNHFPWFATKGTDVYAGDSIVNNPKDLSNVDEDKYLRVDYTSAILSYNMRDEEDRGRIDTFTGFLGVGGNSENYLGTIEGYATQYSTLGVNVVDTMNKANTFYEYFMLTLSKRESSLIELASLDNISGCTGYCFYRSKDSITVDSGLVCSSPILIASDEDIIIEPDVKVTEGNNGCIFLAKGNIIIKEGTKKTNDYDGIVDYDYIYGFLLANGLIIIDNDSYNDGLEVVGGIVAFASKGLDECSSYEEYDKYGGCKSAIAIFRNVGSSNYENNKTNPSFIASYDPRYRKIASYFFGLKSYYYKTDIGLKL